MKSKIATLVLLLALLAWGAFYWLAPHHVSSPATVSSSTTTNAPIPGKPSTSAASSQRPTLPPIDPPTIPPTIRPIFGLVGETFSARIAAISKLGRRELEPAEVKALYAFLARPGQGSRPALDGEAAIKNDVINVLFFQPRPPEGLAAVLAGLYRDRAQDEVMRDYALQHLYAHYEQLSPESVKDRAIIEQALWEAQDETNGSLAGTALLGLHRLAGPSAPIDLTRLNAAALRLAKDEGASELSRIAGLQVCALRSVGEAAPSAQALVGGAATMPLQISAIAALGRLGTPKDVPLLEGLAQGPETRLRPAAVTALASLRRSLGGGTTEGRK